MIEEMKPTVYVVPSSAISARRKNWEEQQMMNDQIVKEIRRVRKEHAAQHGNDLNRIAEAFREKERTSGRVQLNPLEKKAGRL